MEIYIVKQGDTLQSVAEMFGLPVEKLARDNGLYLHDILVSGQSLVIAYPKQVYIVEEGDSLFDIAERFNVSVNQLLVNNPFLADREYIYPGESIVIYYSNEKAGKISTYGYAYPHIGSDVLRTVAVNMRRKLIDLGGEIRFGAKVTSVKIVSGRAVGVTVNGSEEIKAGAVVLAVGHSARDTFKELLTSGVQMVQKPFSIGVRIEHPQRLINAAQYGSEDISSIIGPADYQLYCKIDGRTAYSFCMCPGGVVVASASEPDTIVTNGMSYFARDRENANSAFVVSVEPGDFGGSDPLAGVEFQRKWEKEAFRAGGSDGAAPIQLLADFMENRPSKRIGSVRPSYTGNVFLADLNTCLPEFVTTRLKEAAVYFDRRVKGFGMADALLTGVETRTSSPVRITRGDTYEAVGIRGLFPCGEGAGYAGGIVSAAVDGIRVAEQIIRTYSIPE